MNKKLFFKGLIAATLIVVSSQFASAQDSIKKEAVAKPVAPKPKPVVTQAAGTTYPVKPVTQPVGAAAARPYVPPPAPVESNDRSINGQYQFLLARTYGYQRPILAAFYKSVTDTLGFERKKLKPLQASVTVLTDSVKNLHSQLSTQNSG